MATGGEGCDGGGRLSVAGLAAPGDVLSVASQPDVLVGEFILELAVSAKCSANATHNVRSFDESQRHDVHERTDLPGFFGQVITGEWRSHRAF